MSRIKQEKIAPELDTARSKLDGVLQHLMERTDESQSSSGDESTKHSLEVIIKEPSPVASPTKKQTHRTQRKRRRKDDITTKNTNSYVLKLYDRSVDLAQFSENTPLYPVCRAWMHNQPNNSSSYGHNHSPSSSSQDLLDDGKDDSKNKYIRQLPPPLKTPKTEDGVVRDMRIPSPIPPSQEEFVICSDEQGAPPKEFLLSKHMERWRAIRQKWKQASMANEERYRESGMILKSIFERHVLCERRTQNISENIFLQEVPVSDQWDGLTATT